MSEKETLSFDARTIKDGIARVLDPKYIDPWKPRPELWLNGECILKSISYSYLHGYAAALNKLNSVSDPDGLDLGWKPEPPQ